MIFGVGYTTDPGPIDQGNGLTDLTGSSFRTDETVYSSVSAASNLFHSERGLTRSSFRELTGAFGDQFFTHRFTSITGSTANKTGTTSTTESSTWFSSSGIGTEGSSSTTFSSQSTSTTTSAPLSLVTTVTASVTAFGLNTTTQTFEDSVVTASEKNTLTTTLENTRTTNEGTLERTSFFLTTETYSTVSPVTARTFNISYPQIGEIMFNAGASTEPFTGFPASQLQTIVSLFTLPVYGAAVRFTESQSFSRLSSSIKVDTITTTSWFGAEQITRQIFVHSLNAYTTTTQNVFGGGTFSTNETTIATGVEIITTTNFQFTASTFSARATRPEFFQTTVFTDQKTTIRQVGHTTTTDMSYITGVTTGSFPVSVSIPGESPVFPSGFTNRTFTFLDNFTPIWRALLQQPGFSSGFISTPRSGAVAPAGEMSISTLWGLGMTGLPSDWSNARGGLHYSTVFHDRNPVVVPFVSGNWESLSVSYAATSDLSGVTMRSTSTNTSTTLTGSRSFSWNTVLSSIPASWLDSVRQIEQFAVATRYAPPFAEIALPDTTQTNSQFHSLTAEPGESVRIRPIWKVTAEPGAPAPIIYSTQSPVPS